MTSPMEEAEEAQDGLALRAALGFVAIALGCALVAARRIGDFAGGERADAWELFLGCAGVGVVIGWIVLVISNRESTPGVPSLGVQMAIGVVSYTIYSVFSRIAPLVLVSFMGVVAGAIVASLVWILLNAPSSARSTPERPEQRE